MEGSIECFDTLICSGARRLTGYQRVISDNYISPRRQLRFPTSPGSVFMVILQTEGGLPWRLSRIDRFDVCGRC